MPFALRPNESSGKTRADYAVIYRDHDGDPGYVVGRIYFGVGARGDKWLYAINGWGSELAATLDDAKAKIKDVWDRLPPEQRPRR